MTLLHQAAQKAVEQLKRLTDGRGGIAHFARTTEQAGTVRELIAALESALQQQPEPVALPLTDAEADAIHSMPWARDCLLRYVDRPCDKEARDAVRAIVNAASGLMVGTTPPVLQHQEVPREPVARNPLPAETAQPMFASHVGRRKWEQLQGDGYRMQRIHFARSVDGHERRGTIDPWGKVLWEAETAASPSTTRQQEVGSRPYRTSAGDTLRGIAHRELGDAERWPEIKRLNMHAFDPESEGWSRPRAGTLLTLPAAPSTPENAGGVGGNDASR